MAHTRANSGKAVLARKSIRGNVVTVRKVAPIGTYARVDRA